MTIADEIARRGIQEVVHFTTNRGIVGMLAARAVFSRRRLRGYQYLQHILHPNSPMRLEEAAHFDKSADWLDFVNISISEINRSFYGFSRRWPHNQDIYWIILAFDPVILTHEDVYFATTNNSYEHCRRQSGLLGFQELFADSFLRKGNWRAFRRQRSDWLTTCEQAEVLYPSALPFSFLRRVYVSEGEDADRVRGWLREFGYEGVEVTIDRNKFIGAPN
jgi:hypothetical protein